MTRLPNSSVVAAAGNSIAAVQGRMLTALRRIMRILHNIRPDRQTVMFSATFPKSVEILARKIVEIRPEEERFLRLLEILGEWYEKGKLIIFVGSQVEEVLPMAGSPFLGKTRPFIACKHISAPTAPEEFVWKKGPEKFV
eukprot:626069-Pelagomonas_calceolata.AAC.4